THPARQRFCSFCLSFPGAPFCRTQRGASPTVFSSWSGSPPARPRELSLPSPSSLQVCRDCPIPVVFYFFQTSSQVAQGGFLTLSSSRG
uniref:Uncharacterized protein n=1 Tax=Mus spicilegus TaxID=10103 RepID=A0A8C6GZ82_MUSSI